MSVDYPQGLGVPTAPDIGNGLGHKTFGQGPDLVMIPGWAMHAGVWADWALSLSEFFRVTLVDLPGHGTSPPWQSITLENLSESMASMVSGRVTWLGWSLGGLIALELAHRYPRRTSAIVMMGANARFLGKEGWPGVSRQWYKRFRDRLMEDTPATLNRFLTLVAGNKSQLRQLRGLWCQYPTPDLQTLLQALEILGHSDRREALRGVECPVTLIAGDNDPLLPEPAVDSMSALAPDCRVLLLENAGHAPFLTHAAQMTRALIP